MWDLYAVVEFSPLRVVSMHRTIKAAALAAHKMYRHAACDVMALVLDDNDKPIGIQELTAREKRSIIGWQPEFKMRAADIVKSRHKYDPPDDAYRIQTDPVRHAEPAQKTSHRDVLSNY